MEWVIGIVAGLAVGLLAYLAFSYSPQPKASEKKSATAELRHWFGERLGPLILARQPEYVAKVERKLEFVASPSLPTSGAEFLGGNLGIGILVATAIFLLCIVLQIGIPVGVLLSVGMGGVLFMLGTRRLDNMLAARTKALDKDFPYFLDFVVMTTRAGAVLMDSIALFVDSAGDTVLTREMRDLVNIKASGPGGLLGALDDYRRTCPSETGRNALLAIIAAAPVGVSNSTSLVSLAGDMRHERRQRAERASETIKSSIMMPVTLMLVGVIIAILSGSLPAILFGF